MLQRGLRWLARPQQAARLLPALAGQPRMLWAAWMPAPLITVSRSHLHSDLKDYSLPNSGWSPIMVRLYNELMEKTVDGTWTRLSGYRHSWQFLKEGDLARIAKVVPVQMVEDARLFLRITEMERLGFEYVIFHNNSEKKCICLFQPGPLLEGLPGITHGGALGTMIDTTLFMTAYCSANAVFTGTMTITFKSPITLGSVVRLEANITGVEGRKVFLSCEAQSSDRTVLFAEASVLKPLTGQDGPGSKAEESTAQVKSGARSHPLAVDTQVPTGVDCRVGPAVESVSRPPTSRRLPPGSSVPGLRSYQRHPGPSAFTGLPSNDSKVTPGAAAAPRCRRPGGNAYVAASDQSFLVRLHQWDLLYRPLPTPGSPQNPPADPPTLGPWVQTCWHVGSAPDCGSHGESAGPLERDVSLHREVCPWRWHLLWHPLLSEAVLPARPSPHRPGVSHTGGGLPLGCRGLHVTHHCDQDTVREWAVWLPEHLRRLEEHLSQRRVPGPLQWPDSNTAARCPLFRNLPHVLQPDQKRCASQYGPVGCSPCSRCEFQLWDICWDSGLAGNSTCRCDQNSHAALPSEISVDWPVSHAHFQRLWAAWLLPRQRPPGPPQNPDGSHGVDSLRRDDGQDGPEVLTQRGPGKDGTCCPAWFLPRAASSHHAGVG